MGEADEIFISLNLEAPLPVAIWSFDVNLVLNEVHHHFRREGPLSSYEPVGAILRFLVVERAASADARRGFRVRAGLLDRF